MRITTAVVIAISLSITACSTNPANPGHDGIHLWGGGTVSTSDAQKIKDQLTQNAKSSTAKAGAQEALDSEPVPGTVVVGNVGSLRALDVAARPDFYKKAYVVGAQKWHPGQPTVMTESDFTSKVAGYTGIVLWSVPGVISSRRTVAVYEADVPTIDFPSQGMASFWGTTGDLVVARQNVDGVYFINQVLCKKSAADYSKCEDQFARGTFDQNTGEEVGNDRAPKSGGARIDVTTFRTVPKI